MVSGMQTLERDIQDAERLIAGMPVPQARKLEKSLRQLSPAQRAYVAGTLRQVQDDQTLPARYLQFLEYFFEKWSSHSLATKLVLIDRITRLAARSQSQDPVANNAPADVFGLPDTLCCAS